MANFTLDNAVDHVWRLLRDLGDDEDHQLLTNDEIRSFLDQASHTHAMYFPVRVAEDVVADGTTFTPLPTAWESGLSSMVSVESPIGDEPPTLADPRQAGIYMTPTGEKWMWHAGHPANGESIRFLFTASPGLAELEADTTLPNAHFYPLCDLAASISADAIASKYAQTAEPVISVDAATYQKTSDWIQIARRLEDRYRAALGLPASGGAGSTAGGPTVQGVSAIVNWDTHPPGRADYLVHRRITR